MLAKSHRSKSEMSDKIGVVQKVSRSAKGFYSILLDDNEWYGYAMHEPKDSKGRAVAAGDTAKFTYNVNGTFKNIEKATLKVKAAPPGTVAPVSDYDKTQQRICMAGAINTALNLVTHAHTSGMIKFTGKEQYAALWAMVYEEAEMIYKTVQATPDHHEDLVKVESEKPEKLLEGMDMPEEANEITAETWDE